jgi:hypothetical protein
METFMSPGHDNTERVDPATISALRQPARQTLLLFALASTELVL